MSQDPAAEAPVTGLEGDLIHAAYVERGDVGYHHALSNLQIQMIAIGGAIGVGLFLGVGAPLAAVGPALVFSYLLVAVVVYLMMRALGEMVLYRPTTGAWVSYAREFVSDRFSHLTGWIYVVIAALAGIAELSAIGVYVQYWSPAFPGWLASLLALLIIAGANALSVRAFGTIELGAASIKVLAILAFLTAGVFVIVLSMFGAIDSQASVANLWAHGGVFPNGVLAAVIVLQAVVFSFSAVEIVGISAGEAKDPQKTMPQAIRSVVLRIGLFYIGSILVLAMLLPTSSYSGDESPFVTAMESLGITGLAGIMNFVVLTAAISGVNATLYATVRLLRNLSANGRAPKFTDVMSSRGIPIGALLTIGTVYLLGVGLIYLLGAGDAFEIILGACAVFIVFGWIAIFVSHLGYRRQVAAGHIVPPTFRMPGSPYTDYICLVLLGIFFVSMVFNFSNPHWWYSLIAAIGLPALILLSYEYFVRKTPADVIEV